MSQSSVISIGHVNYHYGKEAVLKDINLDFEQGFFSIIGPNGSGKTTLLKLASGLLDIQTGDVWFNGVSIQRLSNLQRARCLSVVQQKQYFPFPFTCLEMVAMGRYPHRKTINGLDTVDYEIVVQSMKETNTLQFKDKLITEVSGGEQQRVIMACALSQQPKVLFLDEAFSAMDISYQASFVDLLRKLVRENGLTVVSVVHDLNLAYRYSDKVCVLKDGEVKGFGHPHVVMTIDSVSDWFGVNVELIERRCFLINV